METLLYVVVAIFILGAWAFACFCAGKGDGIREGYDLAMESIQERSIHGEKPCNVSAFIRENKDGKYSVHFGEWVEGQECNLTYCTEIDNRFDSVKDAVYSISRFFPEARIHCPTAPEKSDANQELMNTAANVSTMAG